MLLTYLGIRAAQSLVADRGESFVREARDQAEAIRQWGKTARQSAPMAVASMAPDPAGAFCALQTDAARVFEASSLPWEEQVARGKTGLLKNQVEESRDFFCAALKNSQTPRQLSQSRFQLAQHVSSLNDVMSPVRMRTQRRLFESSIAADGLNRLPRLHLAKHHLKEGNKEVALAELKKAEAIEAPWDDMTEPYFWNMKAGILLATGDETGALSLLAKTLSQAADPAERSASGTWGARGTDPAERSASGTWSGSEPPTLGAPEVLVRGARGTDPADLVQAHRIWAGYHLDHNDSERAAKSLEASCTAAAGKLPDAHAQYYCSQAFEFLEPIVKSERLLAFASKLPPQAVTSSFFTARAEAKLAEADEKDDQRIPLLNDAYAYARMARSRGDASLKTTFIAAQAARKLAAERAGPEGQHEMFRKAVQLFEEAQTVHGAAETWPTEIHLEYGLALQELGEDLVDYEQDSLASRKSFLEKALAVFDKALERHPDNSTALLFRGANFYMEAKHVREYSKSIHVLKEVLERFKKLPVENISTDDFGAVYRMYGWAVVEQAFEKIKAGNYELALQLMKEHRVDELLTEAAPYVQGDRWTKDLRYLNFRYRYLLARAMDHDRIQRAADTYPNCEPIVQFEPRGAMAGDDVKKAYAEYDQAHDWIEKLATLENRPGMLNYYRGLIRFRQGRYLEARELLVKCLEEFPSDDKGYRDDAQKFIALSLQGRNCYEQPRSDEACDNAQYVEALIDTLQRSTPEIEWKEKLPKARKGVKKYCDSDVAGPAKRIGKR